VSAARLQRGQNSLNTLRRLKVGDFFAAVENFKKWRVQGVPGRVKYFHGGVDYTAIYGTVAT